MGKCNLSKNVLSDAVKSVKIQKRQIEKQLEQIRETGSTSAMNMQMEEIRSLEEEMLNERQKVQV